jgi:hypothetical protein
MTRSNENLGTIELRLRILTDSDGDLFAEIEEVTRVSMFTKDLEYLGVRGFFGEEVLTGSEVREALMPILEKRPNRGAGDGS